MSQLRRLGWVVIIEVVHSHGGWVNKFIGDAALCVLGVPTRTTDYASQALDAGKLISQRLAALPRAVDCGIGISTGVVTAGNLGNETRYEYTVIGDTVPSETR